MKISFLKVWMASIVSVISLSAKGSSSTGGGCYNLQIIALKSKSADMTGSNGHSIFVVLGGKTRILLQEGPFKVIDRNGTDGSASFSLPNPDPTNAGSSAYSVFARVVGKPGSGMDLSTCGTDSAGELFCSQETLSMSRLAGRSKFQNVTQQMLYVYADINGDEVIDRVPLFDSRLQDYFWDLDASGRLHAQLRFCPVSTTVK